MFEQKGSYILNKTHLPEMIRLLEYVILLQDSGFAVQYTYAGHVDSLDISVQASPERYTEVVYSAYPTLQSFTDIEKEDMPGIVDGIIKDIQTAVDDFNLKEQELAKLAELKAKYEPETVLEEAVSVN